MSAAFVEVSPFVRPCPEEEKRFIDCEKEAQVGDFLTAMAEFLGVSSSKLSVVQVRGDGCNVVLGAKENIPSNVAIKGTKTMAGVPQSVLVRGKVEKQTMTRTEALGIQKDTIELYSDELLQLQVKNVQKAFLQRMQAGDKFKGNEYGQQVRVLIQPLQEKLLSKWGYPPGQRGFVIMQSVFQNNFGTDAEIQETRAKIDGLLGTDFSWIPDTLSGAFTGGGGQLPPGQAPGAPGVSESHE